MDKEAMMQEVYNQLSIDYNCAPDDFLKNEIVFTQAKELEGRRSYPFTTPRLELVTFGNGAVINCSSDIIDEVKKRMKGKSVYEIFNMPFVFGVNPYYLPNLNHLPQLMVKNNDYEYSFVEKQDICNLYIFKGFNYALQYDANSPHTEELAVVVKQNNNVVGIASAVSECKMMWQINVDVVTSCRRNNLASTMVNMLTNEVLNRGYIPYYSTDCTNVISQRVAVKAGYLPVWSHCFKIRPEFLSSHTNSNLHRKIKKLFGK